MVRSNRLKLIQSQHRQSKKSMRSLRFGPSKAELRELARKAVEERDAKWQSTHTIDAA